MSSLIPTVVTGTIILLIICAAIFIIVRDRRKGRGCCGMECRRCGSCVPNIRIDEDDEDR
jgi:hypothetical protein